MDRKKKDRNKTVISIGNGSKTTTLDVPGHQASTGRVLLTSHELGWHGFLVETRLHTAGEFRFAASDTHLLSLHLGPPICLDRAGSDGRVRQEQVEYGDIIVVSAGQTSLWRHTETSHFQNITISAALLDRAAELLVLGQTKMLVGASPASFRDPHIEHLAMLLRLEMETGSLYGSLYAEILANALCVHLLRRESSLAPLPALAPPASGLFRVELQRATTYIQDNLTTDLSLDTIARVSGISTYHFAHLFAQMLGISPHQYVIRARIERAKVLIARDGLRPSEVALLVGFSDQSHFTRHFTRLVGITPRVFAQGANRKNIL